MAYLSAVYEGSIYDGQDVTVLSVVSQKRSYNP